SQDLEGAADVDQPEVPGQVRRHDLQIEVGPDEVEGPGADEEQGEEHAVHGPEPWPLHALGPSSRGRLPALWAGRGRLIPGKGDEASIPGGRPWSKTFRARTCCSASTELWTSCWRRPALRGRRSMRSPSPRIT